MSDRTSYSILRGCQCDIIFDVHVTTEDGKG